MDEQKDKFQKIDTIEILENEIEQLANQINDKNINYIESPEDQIIIEDLCLFHKDPIKWLEEKFLK